MPMMGMMAAEPVSTLWQGDSLCRLKDYEGPCPRA